VRALATGRREGGRTLHAFHYEIALIYIEGLTRILINFEPLIDRNHDPYCSFNSNL